LIADNFKNLIRSSLSEDTSLVKVSETPNQFAWSRYTAAIKERRWCKGD